MHLYAPKTIEIHWNKKIHGIHIINTNIAAVNRYQFAATLPMQLVLHAWRLHTSPSCLDTRQQPLRRGACWDVALRMPLLAEHPRILPSAQCRATASVAESAPSSSSPSSPTNPLAPMSPLLRITRGIVSEEFAANSTGMQLSFLGSSCTLPPGFRPIASTALRNAHSVWLFNVAEDTQRYLHNQPQLGHRKIERMFITQRHPDNLLGLPGLLCTLSAAREVGHKAADVPLYLYGPPGLAQYINTMLAISDTYLLCPVLVHEMVTGPVAAADREPECINQRARIYRVPVPPDQLNEEGYHTSFLEALLKRHKVNNNLNYKKRKATLQRVDARANMRDLPLPSPGDPTHTDVPLAEMRWTFHTDASLKVVAFPLKSDGPCWGYRVQEADRAGRLDVQACERLNVFGKARGTLKEGKAVTLKDGTQVLPEQVLSPDRPGRRVVILGPTGALEGAAAECANADAVVMEVVDDGGSQAGVCTVTQALEFAAATGTQQLLVVGSDQEHAARAREVVQGVQGAAVVGNDQVLVVPLRE